jgi:K+ transporter
MPRYNFTFIFIFTCVPGSYFIHKRSMLYLTNWQQCEIKLPRKIPSFDVWHPVMLSILTALIHCQAHFIITQLFTLLKQSILPKFVTIRLI